MIRVKITTVYWYVSNKLFINEILIDCQYKQKYIQNDPLKQPQLKLGKF